MRTRPPGTGIVKRVAGGVPRSLRFGALDRSLLGSLMAGGASQLSLVVSGVLVARGLGPTDRGFFALIVLVPQILSQIGTLGLPVAATYFIARERSIAADVIRSLRTPAVAQVLGGALVQGCVFLFLLHPHGRTQALAEVVGLGILPGMLGLQYGLGLLQGQQKFKMFNVLRVLPSALYSALVIPLFLLGGSDVLHFTAAYAFSLLTIAAATLTIGIRAARGETSASPKGGHLVGRDVARRDAAPTRRRLLSFGLRGLLGSMSPIETFRLDQAVIGLFLTPTALGLYVAGVSFTNLPRFLTQSVGMVAYPRVASAESPRASYRTIWRHFWIAIAVAVAVVAPLEVVAGKLVEFFFGAQFASSASIARILLAGTVALGARRVLADGLRGVGFPGAGTIAEVASWMALVPALLILVHWLGVDGVALALAVSWFVSAAVLVAIAARGMAKAAALPLSGGSSSGTSHVDAVNA